MSHSRSGDDWSARIGHSDASRLLRLGIERDDLVVDARFHELLATPPIALPAAAETLLVDGGASLETLHSLKTAAQARFTAEHPAAERLAAGVWYYLSIAAARVHHGVLLTTRPPTDVQTGLTRLGGRVPEPWRGLLIRAASLIDPPPVG